MSGHLDNHEPAPKDIVPNIPGPPLDLHEGQQVTVMWPGDVILDVDGFPIAMTGNTTYEMTVNKSGLLTGWATDKENRS